MIRRQVLRRWYWRIVWILALRVVIVWVDDDIGTAAKKRPDSPVEVGQLGWWSRRS